MDNEFVERKFKEIFPLCWQKDDKGDSLSKLKMICFTLRQHNLKKLLNTISYDNVNKIYIFFFEFHCKN